MHVIVLFSKMENARSIRNLLLRYGFSVTAVCTTGAQALSAADQAGSGILVCGYRYPDMLYDQMRECLPPGFDTLLVVPQSIRSEYLPSDAMCVTMPVQVQDFINTLELLQTEQARRRKKKRLRGAERTEEEKELIRQAKELLMERNHLTEEEAHRYMQKCSMDSGTGLTETAQMVLTMMRI